MARRAATNVGLERDLSFKAGCTKFGRSMVSLSGNGVTQIYLYVEPA